MEYTRLINHANVMIQGDKVDKKDIQAMHRIGEKGNVICKFINRIFVYEALH